MVSSIHRPTQALIDLSAISRNIQRIQMDLPQGVQTFAVVKADAYGHGAVAVSKHIASQVDYFCVSNLDEAIELRQAGIVKPILVLGVVLPQEVSLAIRYQVSLTVASLDWLDSIENHSLVGLTVHLKIDTGMGRIGLRSNEEVKTALDDLRQKGAYIEGLFTHFATADEKDDSYFEQQLTMFKSLLGNLKEVPPMIHASNSATTLWHNEGIFNAVRLGIVIYGLNPSGAVLPLPYPLEPALRLNSQLVQVKQLAAQQKIGYGASYETSDEEWIGTVPIGYADGLTRQMQGFSVLVDGHYCEIVGRVSMDQITIRLPRPYAIGTPVILIGRDGDTAITATDIASYLGTINYEVLCLLSGRIPRVYD